jgi:hypothetical protein
MVEAGELGNGYQENRGIGKISPELRSNPEFMSLVLDKLTAQGAWGFWAHAIGETANDKNLFIEAIKKNPINYQFGKTEWNRDPKVRYILTVHTPRS